MNPGTTQPYKLKFKKKLYHFLLDLNDRKFRKYRPLVFLIVLAGIFLVLSKLPTTETIQPDSAETFYGADIAAAIRSTTPQHGTPAADIVALFLPNDISSTESSALSEEALYSFYLTGEELSYLAEGAVLSSKDTTLYLDGLNYTYHKNRLPFDRITALSTSSGVELLDNALYHVISTEEIFSLLHYISYRSIGIMTIYPKDMTGTPLSDYQKILLTESSEPLTIRASLALTSSASNTTTAVPSVITVQSGFNIIALLKAPNQITLCILVLLLTLCILLGYILPRLRRIGVWFRIYRIRRKKRSSHTLYHMKKRY